MSKKTISTKPAIEDYLRSGDWEAIPDLEALLGIMVRRNKSLNEVAVFVEPETVEIFDLSGPTIANLWRAAKLSNFDYIWKLLDRNDNINFEETEYFPMLIKSFGLDETDDLYSKTTVDELDTKLYGYTQKGINLDPDLFPALALFVAAVVRMDVGGRIALDASEGFRGPVVVANDVTIDCYTEVLRHLFECISSEWSFSEYINTLKREAKGR